MFSTERGNTACLTITSGCLKRPALYLIQIGPGDDYPGEVLADDLEALEMSAAELSRLIKVPTHRITGILNGQRAVTGDTALRLGYFFGTSAEFWLNLQTLYELRLAEAKTGTEVKSLPKLSAAQRKGRATASDQMRT